MTFHVLLGSLLLFSSFSKVNGQTLPSAQNAQPAEVNVKTNASAKVAPASPAASPANPVTATANPFFLGIPVAPQTLVPVVQQNKKTKPPQKLPLGLPTLGGSPPFSSTPTPTSTFSPSGGSVEECGGGFQVADAYKQAMKFRSQCSLANRASSQKIAINDYSGSTTPTMFIFSATGQCLYKTLITYGNGGGTGKPEPCSDNNSHMTPPGFHLTAKHLGGATYSVDKSLLMVGLEGQGSAVRNILIHPAESPGTASSWGCSGVGNIQKIKSILGEGALVYNYFGNTQTPSNCGSSAGMSHSTACQLDRSSPNIPASSNASDNDTAK
jgi:hypothetical protein